VESIAVPRPTLLFDLRSTLAIMHGSGRATKAVKTMIHSSLEGLSCQHITEQLIPGLITAGLQDLWCSASFPNILPAIEYQVHM